MDKIDYDDTDIRLLELIQGDATKSLNDLSKELFLSRSACWRRIQNLEEDGIIEQRITVLNPEKLGLELTCFIFIRTNQHTQQWSDKFKEVISELTEVVEVYRMSGDVDYLVKAMVRDMKDYDSLYQSLIKAELFDVSAGFVMEKIKHTHAIPLPD
jgi:Lrp/AsnC family transcriptional regulator